MKHGALFSLLAFCLSSSIRTAAPQTTTPTQTAVASVPKQPKWTQADRKRLLAKAHSGDSGSQMWLGAAYEQGWFGKANFHEALKWFRKAAAQGDPDAQNALGQMYQDGEGVKQGYAEAAKWFRLAAEHIQDLGGAGQGRNNLGLLYLRGDGVPKDYVQAYMWFKLTAHETNLPDAKAQMTPAQIVEAEQMAAEWKRSHPELTDSR
jgi:TPR repeat protein